MEKKTAQELDYILNEFKTRPAISVPFMKVRQAIGTEKGLEFPLMNYINELERLGYIVGDVNKRDYKITFQGRIFKGFENEIEKENAEKQSKVDFLKYQKDQNDKMVALQSRIVSLTRWVMFGTLVAGLYYLNEICKYYRWFDFCCP